MVLQLQLLLRLLCFLVFLLPLYLFLSLVPSWFPPRLSIPPMTLCLHSSSCSDFSSYSGIWFFHHRLPLPLLLLLLLLLPPLFLCLCLSLSSPSFSLSQSLYLPLPLTLFHLWHSELALRELH